MNDDHRRRVPRTDVVLGDPRLAPAIAALGASLVKSAVTAAQESVRTGELEPDEVVDDVIGRLPSTACSLRRVINATGILLHSNLGRAHLSDAAIAALSAAAGTTDVELDLDSGRRGRRGMGALAALTDAVPSAEAAHVVNNGAAALVLCTTGLALGREVVISRGELVEIGDGFRIPDLLRATGASLREVGTTNRTTLRDYAEAIGPQTGMVLKVHPSNFVVTGFTSQVPVADLATLGVPVIVDIGSGLLAPHRLLPLEPDAETALRAGADVVTASGDKLLGGPQAGLILGRADIVERLRRHPLARALRVDKLTLAALEATLCGPVTPVIVALEASVDDLLRRATTLHDRLVEAGIEVTMESTSAQVGGGGAPGVDLPSVALALPERFASELRRGEPVVLGRVERGRCLLDLRSIPPKDDAAVFAAVLAVVELTITDHGSR